MAIRVLLCDDHAIVRQGLKVLLAGAGFDVVAEACDGREAVAQARRLHPDVAVLDVVMPILNGLGAAGEIQEVSPSTRCILLTSRHDEQLILEAMRVGIRGCVLKTYQAGDLIRAIEDVMSGDVYLSPAVSRWLLDAYRSRTYQPCDPLSDRERQVLQLIAEGKPNRKIAALLGVSVKTAESHRTHIMKKLNIGDTAGLVRYAIQRGLSPL